MRISAVLMSDSVGFCRSVLKDILAAGGHDAQTVSGLQVHDVARPGQVVLRLPLTNGHLNRLGSVHGGLHSTLMDIGGNMALASAGFFKTGVSTEIHTRFTGKATLESTPPTLEIVGTIDLLGARQVFTSIIVRNPEETKTIYAIGSHTKVVASHEWFDERNCRFDAEGKLIVKGPKDRSEDQLALKD